MPPQLLPLPLGGLLSCRSQGSATDFVALGEVWVEGTVAPYSPPPPPTPPPPPA